MEQSWLKRYWKIMTIIMAIILLFILFILFGGSVVSPDLRYFPE